VSPIRFAFMQRLIPISTRSYLRALASASTCSVALAVVWLLTEGLLKGGTSELVIAAAASVIGAAA